jgi:hypothetical protein
MCYLVAARTTCLHSSSQGKSLQWKCVRLITISFLIRALILVLIVLSWTTSLTRQSLCIMSIYCVWSHLWRSRYSSDCQLVYRSSYGCKRTQIHHLVYRWMVPWVIPQRRHPHLQMTLIYCHCQCIECARVHKVWLCIACTLWEWLAPKESNQWVWGDQSITNKDALWCIWSLSWTEDQLYREIQDCCRNRSKEALYFGPLKIPLRRAPP